MARETWGQMKSRVTKNIRNRTDIATDAEGWLRRSYSEITATYPFFIFDGEFSFTLAAGTAESDIAVVAPELRFITSLRNTTTTKKVEKGAQRLRDKMVFEAPGEPRQYAHYGTKLLFDTTADQPYAMMLKYKKIFEEPNFATSVSPETPDYWDDVIYHRAMAKGYNDLYEGDRAEYHRGLMLALIAELPSADDVESEDNDFGMKYRVSY